MADGLSPPDATRKAMLEVTGPVIATTLVLLAVFVPIAFTPGLTGRLFEQFAATIAIVIGLLSTVARPWAYREVYEVGAAAAASTELERIRAGQFYVDDNAGRTIFIQGMSEDRRQLQGIFIRSRDNQGLQVTSSATGFFEPFATEDHHKLVLVDDRFTRQLTMARTSWAASRRFPFS